MSLNSKSWRKNFILGVKTFSSIKGRVGKSSVVLLLANNLASRGRKVLVIDTDLNNTVTVYYTMGIGRIGEICERQNVSLAFSMGKIDDKNIVQSRKQNVSVVPSSLRLLDQRSMESVEIKRVLRSVTPEQAKKTYFLFNHWSEQYAKYPSSMQNLVFTMYRQNFDNLLSVTLPDTSFVDRYTNFGEKCNVSGAE